LTLSRAHCAGSSQSVRPYRSSMRRLSRRTWQK
jgi:hypothetical protein